MENKQSVIKWIRSKARENKVLTFFSYRGTSHWWSLEKGLYTKILNTLNSNEESKKRLSFFSLKRLINNWKINNIIWLFFFKVLTRYFFGRFLSKEPKFSNSCDVLAVSYTSYWSNYSIVNSDSQKIYEKDGMLGNLLSKLREKEKVISLDSDSSLFVDFKTLFEKNSNLPGFWFPVEKYLDYDILRRVLSYLKIYKMRYTKLSKASSFSENWKYKDIDLSSLILEHIELFIHKRLFWHILYTELMIKAIAIEKPQILLITCAYCRLGRASVIAGKVMKIPSIEIQHGVIHPSHYSYIYDKSIDKDLAPSLPNKIAVFGNYYFNLLTQRSIYNKEQVVVTGQPRYDSFLDINMAMKRSSFLKKNAISEDTKIVLWTLQANDYPLEKNMEHLNLVFSVIDKYPKLTVLLKPHPHDRNSNLDLLQNFSKNRDNVQIYSKSFNTFELLYVCDLLLSRYSTTVTEAIGLEKEVILINFENDIETEAYTKEGNITQVKNRFMFNEQIARFLSKEKSPTEYRDKFVDNFLYKMDGNSTQRIVKLMDEIIKK